MKLWKAAMVLGAAITQILGVSVGHADTLQTSSDVNLAAGKTYTVSSDVVDDYFHQMEVNNYPDNGTVLTDGTVPGTSDLSLANLHSGQWAGYLRQDRHDVVVDLGSEQTLHKLDAFFLQANIWGIMVPDSVTFAVSNNGTAWSTVGTVQSPVPQSDPTQTVQDLSVTNLNVSARYVRYEFAPAAWAFLSEVQAWGIPGKTQGANLVPTPANPQPPQDFPLAGSSAAGGKKAEVLIPNGWYKSASNPIGKWTTADFVPYVGYLDTQGNIKDYMFDSFQFDPYATGPSGGTYGGPGTATQADWQYYADQLFQQDQQLGALNQAVGIVKSALPNRDYSAKVVIGIPYPGTTSDWGSGLDMSPADVGEQQSLANRLAAVQWYVNYVISKWNQVGYSNLTLDGFYWINEKIPSYTPDENQLIQGASQIVHSAGNYTFDWIPYVMSEGYQYWKTDGFNTALMQPNYAFTGGATTQRLQDTSAVANRYGMGIEMEMGYNMTADTAQGDADRARYQAYLDAAYAYHYKNSFLTWYQNTQTLLQSEESTDPAARSVYDETYQFINGTYQPTYRPGPGATGNNHISTVDTTPASDYNNLPTPHDSADADGAIEASWASQQPTWKSPSGQ